MDMEQGPGKFEGEPTYVRHYWDAVMDGMEEESITDAGYDKSAFKITDDDATQFPDLADSVGQWIVVWESDVGFVYHAILTQAEFDNAMEQASHTIAEDE